jgi:exodeoxyribonuclease-3
VLDKIYKVFEDKLKLGKDIIVCGDFNIAHHEKDLKNFKGNKKNSGFLPDEREWLTKLFTKGRWTDVYRTLHPEEGEGSYTWWSNRGQAWQKNVGWRIDYQISNYENAIKAKKAYVYKDERFSDHAPLIIEYD